MLDTYAHHPTELAADLRAAREIIGGRGTGGNGRVIAVFQPHLYSRTRIFAAEFGAALGLADEVVVLDVYAAREDPEPGVTGRLVADAVPGGAAHYVADFGDVPKVVAALAAPGDLVLTMGAGDITRMGPLVLAEIAGPAPRGLARREPGAPMSDTPPHRARRRDASRGRAPRRHEPCRRARRPAAGGPATAARAARGARAPRAGARRRRTRWRAAFFALAGLAIVAGVGWALLGNRVLVVRSVTVTGTHLLAPAQVIAAADVPLGTPLLSVDTGRRDAPGGGDPRRGVRHRDRGLAGPPGHHGHRARPRHGGPDGGRRLRPRGPVRGDRALREGAARRRSRCS